MIRLVWHECCKIWLKRKVQMFFAVFFALNIFFLWYANMETETTSSVGYYHKLNTKLAGMTNEEKLTYLSHLDEENQGVYWNGQVNLYEGSNSTERKEFAEIMREKYGQIINQYHDIWKKGEYLKYSDTLDKQKSLIASYLGELKKTMQYQEFLDDIQSKSEMMSGMSVFAETQNDGFSCANIEKTANDYKEMRNLQLDYVNSKGPVGITENAATDLFLVVFLLITVSAVVFEEKQKRLFHITKTTPSGRIKSVIAKQIAILVTELGIVVVFELSNILFYQFFVGGIDWTASMQSVAPWMAGTLKLSIVGYIILFILVKAIIMGILGCIFHGLAIFTSHIIYPFLLGSVIMTASVLLYITIPASSSLNWFKYLNPVGMLQINKAFAEYINLNFFGTPVQLRNCIIFFLILIVLIIGTINVIGYLGNGHMEVKENLLKHWIEKIHIVKFKPHNSLVRHELYKILVMNKALWIILIFGAMLIYHGRNMSYNLSSGEIRYRSYMNYLEGELNREKEDFIATERKKYEDAFAMIEKIDSKCADGEISEDQADEMKMPYEEITAYYYVFQKVETQYEFIQIHPKTEFVYDTGYNVLLGKSDKHLKTFIIEFLSVLILCFSSVEAVEYSKSCNRFLFVTPKGRTQLRFTKYMICSLLTGGMLAAVTAVRLYLVNHYFGISSPGTSMKSLLCYHWMPEWIPIWLGLVVAFLIVYLLSLIIMTLISLLSRMTKNVVYTLLLSALISITPIVIFM